LGQKLGGGTPILEASRVGCNVIGFDINPMSYWIVKQEIEHLKEELMRYGLNRITDDKEVL
jgi:adenine-specific DNA methylase